MGWEMLLHVLHVPTPSPGEGKQQSGASLRGGELAVGNESLLCPAWLTLVHVCLEGLSFCFFHSFFLHSELHQLLGYVIWRGHQRGGMDLGLIWEPLWIPPALSSSSLSFVS